MRRRPNSGAAALRKFDKSLRLKPLHRFSYNGSRDAQFATEVVLRRQFARRLIRGGDNTLAEGVDNLFNQGACGKVGEDGVLHENRQTWNISYKLAHSNGGYRLCQLFFMLTCCDVGLENLVDDAETRGHAMLPIENGNQADAASSLDLLHCDRQIARLVEQLQRDNEIISQLVAGRQRRRRELLAAQEQRLRALRSGEEFDSESA